MQTEKGLKREYMERAIELAKKGEGWAHPNPLVGAVIVKDDRIIGEGYHAKRGELHAERDAIRNLTEPAAGATIYVTLEPCCHYGKQPPCTEAIIEHGISRVVIGSRDPNPLVHGKGAMQLRAAGIEVVSDYMREECDALNDIFFHYITEKTPYVIMKYAMTADGKIATGTGASRWISGEESRKQVHYLRHRCMGIMAGIGTVVKDDPQLNCRIEGGRDPVRIICDSKLSIPDSSLIMRTSPVYETVIACALPDSLPEENRREKMSAAENKMAKLELAGIKVINVPGPDGRVDLGALMKELGEMEIDSILLEGGGTLNEAALKAGIVKEIHVYIAPKIFGGKAPSPVMGTGVELPDDAYMLELKSTELVGEDILLTYRVKERK